MKSKCYILICSLFALVFGSCSKVNDRQTEDTFDQHPTWTDDSTNNFWDKQHGCGFQIDTASDDDISINL